MRNQLTDIFNTDLSQEEAQNQIKEWKEKVESTNIDGKKLRCFDTFLKTLNKHWKEITNYFHQRRSSGFVEGFNNRIKIIKKRCYGIFLPERLFQRIQIDLQSHL